MNFAKLVPVTAFIVFGTLVHVSHSSGKWTYEDNDANGIFRWGDAFPECNGPKQSPINIETSRVRVNRDLYLELGGMDLPHETWIKNNGHTAQLGLLDAPKPNLTGSVVDGKLYQFAQLHFHWGETSDRGSEHSVNSVYWPGEMHLVFFRQQYGDIQNAMNYNDGLAVVGVFLKSSPRNNPNYEPLIYAVHQTPEYGSKSFLPTEITIGQLLPRNTQRFYRYSGSLTTPTCDEIVTWIVLADPVEIGEKQLEVFREERTNYISPRSGTNRLDHNYRYQAPRNGRVVEASFNPLVSYSTLQGQNVIRSQNPYYKDTIYFPNYQYQ